MRKSPPRADGVIADTRRLVRLRGMTRRNPERILIPRPARMSAIGAVRATMRRTADRPGASQMALYRRVPLMLRSPGRYLACSRQVRRMEIGPSSAAAASPPADILSADAPAKERHNDRDRIATATPSTAGTTAVPTGRQPAESGSEPQRSAISCAEPAPPFAACLFLSALPTLAAKDPGAINNVNIQD